MKSLRNKSACVPDSRWLAYAAAGVASAFAAANSAEGTIHYSGPINKVVNRLDRFVFSLDQHHDFIRLSVDTGTAYAGYPRFGVGGLTGAGIVGFLTNNGWPEASSVKWGQLISSQPFIPAHTASVNRYGGFDKGIRYLGFKFNGGNGDQYGWVRIKPTTTFGGRFTLLDFAYGDVGDPIAAGQKRDEPNELEVESLGGLAVGAVGLLAWRKSRVQAAH